MQHSSGTVFDLGHYFYLLQYTKFTFLHLHFPQSISMVQYVDMDMHRSCHSPTVLSNQNLTIKIRLGLAGLH